MAKRLKLVQAKEVGAKKKVAEPGAKSTGAEVKKTKSGPPKSEKATVNLGRTTGLSIAKYQNKTLEENKKARRTDEELAQDWCDEFPNSLAVRRGNITADTVRGVRSLYNKGKHGNGEPPAQPLVEYDETGNPKAVWGTRSAEKRAKEEGAFPKSQKGVVKKGAVKSTGKKVKR